jgi:hypothetical protein
VALIFGIGARKYAERNWERGLKYSAIVGAIGRHTALWSAGQRVDPESGRSHMAHVATLALFALAHELRGVGEDDLPRLSPEALETLVAELENPEDLEAARAEVEQSGSLFGPQGPFYEPTGVLFELCDERYSHRQHQWEGPDGMRRCPGKSTDRT